MAKVPFSKFQIKANNNLVELSYPNLSGEKIHYEVRYYLPIKEKINLITNIVNQSVDDYGFYNPIKVKLYMTLEVVYAYTNLNFTEKMKEDPFKLYDMLISSGIFSNIVDNIRDKDWAEIQENVWTVIDNIYKYNNSVMGILDTLKADYDNLNFDATEIQKKIGDPENIALLRDILTKLG